MTAIQSTLNSPHLPPQSNNAAAPHRTDDGVRRERTGWRDETLSARHRRWGFHCPAVDIDFLMVEYDHGIAMALIEYKHEFAPLQKLNGSSTYDALTNLADRAALPLFVVRYGRDYSWYTVVPVNKDAKRVLPSRSLMTEPEFVEFLYTLRGREMPRQVLSSLETKGEAGGG